MASQLGAILDHVLDSPFAACTHRNVVVACHRPIHDLLYNLQDVLHFGDRAELTRQLQIGTDDQDEPRSGTGCDHLVEGLVVQNGILKQMVGYTVIANPNRTRSAVVNNGCGSTDDKLGTPTPKSEINRYA